MKLEGHFQRYRLVIVTAAVACAGIAGAAPDCGPERCARLDSDAERLACFDAVFGRYTEGAESPAPIEPSKEAVAGPEDDMVVHPSAAPEGALSEAPAAVPRSDSAAQEARPSRRQGEPATSQPDRPREYIATVVALRERARGQMVITLDNGESWSEQYASRGFLVNVGDAVTMKRGLLSSSYRLIAPGGRSYKMTRIDP